MRPDTRKGRGRCSGPAARLPVTTPARFRLIRTLREAVCGLSDEKFAFYGGSVERNGDVFARKHVFRERKFVFKAFYRGSVERNDDVFARNNVIRERKSLFRERRTLFRERRDLFRERRNVALGRRECAPASIRTATARPGDHSPRPTAGPAPAPMPGLSPAPWLLARRAFCV